MTNLIGITGGIASGKSSVATHLARISDWPLIDCDLIVADLTAPDRVGWLALREILPQRFFNTDGKLEKKILREALFRDEHLRSQINSTLHPLVKNEVLRLAETSDQKPYCLVEVPLLFEAGWDPLFRYVVVVFCRTDICQKRIMERDCVDKVQAGLAVAAQMNLSQKASLADYVVDNSGEWQETRQAVQALYEVLCQVKDKPAKKSLDSLE